MSSNEQTTEATTDEAASNPIDFINKASVMDMIIATSSIRGRLTRSRVIFTLLTCIVASLLSIGIFNWVQNDVIPTNQYIIITAITLSLFTYTYSLIVKYHRVIDIMIGLSANMGLAYTLKTYNACPPPIEIELEKIYNAIFTK